MCDVWHSHRSNLANGPLSLPHCSLYIPRMSQSSTTTETTVSSLKPPPVDDTPLQQFCESYSKYFSYPELLQQQVIYKHIFQMKLINSNYFLTVRTSCGHYWNYVGEIGRSERTDNQSNIRPLIHSTSHLICLFLVNARLHWNVVVDINNDKRDIENTLSHTSRTLQNIEEALCNDQSLWSIHMIHFIT
jgi:hypothetical protein